MIWGAGIQEKNLEALPWEKKLGGLLPRKKIEDPSPGKKIHKYICEGKYTFLIPPPDHKWFLN